MNLKPSTIGLLWDAIGAAAPAPLPACAARIVAETAGTGWIGLPDVETMVLARSAALSLLRIGGLLDTFEVQPQWTYARPSQKPQELLGVQRVAAIDFTGMLIRMERAGLAVDPEPMVAALAPILAKRSILSGRALAVHWYARERHRSAPMVFATSPGAIGYGRPERVITPTGYQAELYRDEGGQPFSLEVTAPRWRPRRASLAA